MIRPILLCLLLALAAWGQEAPGRVGRVGQIFGELSFRAGAVDEWAPANVNDPLSDGDQLQTGADSQAELHVGAIEAHLAPQTGISIVLLDDHVFRMRVSGGALNVRIPRMNEGEAVEAQTDFGNFRLLGVGAYRLDAPRERGFASITVRSGAAEAIAAGRSYAVAAGQRLVLSGNPPAADIMEAPAPDPWDEWCASRDEVTERSLEVSEQYVSWEVAGAEELAQYGDWEADETYGACWRPRDLPPGWAPYRFGHWIFKLPWGWTWVDDAPWGFAPAHYGGWVRVRGGLAWAPGRRQAKPRYSPAQVAFSAGRDPRYISWIPLAPGEKAGSRTHGNRGDVTAAPVNAFATSKPIAKARVAIFDRGATIYSERAPDMRPPRRESVRGSAPMLTAPSPGAVEAVRQGLPRPAASRMGLVESPVQAQEETRRTQEGRRAEDNGRAEDQRRSAEESRRAEESGRAEEARRAEDNRRAEDQRRTAEDYRRAEESRRAEEARRAEDNRRAEDQRRAAEESRRAEEGRRAEEARRAEDNRRAEDQRRAAEESRRAEEGRRAEEARRADEARKNDEARKK